MTEPVVSVLLVSFNDLAHLPACLESIPQSMTVSHEILVVDNASADGSADFVAGRFPSVRLIRNGVNPGFGAANNAAVRASRGEWLLFLNTDTIPGPGSVDTLLEVLRQDPGAAAAGPRLHGDGGVVQVSFGRRVDFRGQFIQKFILNPIRRRTLRRARAARGAGWLSAACLLCRRLAFEEAGGFDEAFFLYFEDIDLCVRLRAAGGRLLFVPASRVFHAGGATTRPRKEACRWEYRRSQLRFYRKHASPASLRFLRFSLRLGVFVRTIGGGFRSPEGRLLRENYRRLLKDDAGTE